MAGKAINQYNTFSGSASDVNVLVQETSQTDPNTFEHKKAKLDTIIATLKNTANGIAGLDGNGMIPESLLPAKYDDVVEGYYYNGVFYTTSAHTTAMTATTGRIYIDLGGTGNLYRYTGSAYVQVTDNDLRDDVEEDVAEIEADLANTNNRVTSNSQRIANIEDKSEPFTIEYPSSDYGKGTVPASIEKSGMSVKVKGRSRAWNQLTGNLPVSSINNLTVSYDTTTGRLQVSGTASDNTNLKLIDVSSYPNLSHKYLVLGIPSGSAVNSYGGYFATSGDWVTSDSIINGLTLKGSYNIRIASGVTVNIDCYPIFRDLTLTFGAGNEPTSVTDALKALPDLGKYTPYGYSLPSTIVSGMKSVGVNIWDEEWEVGSINTDGTLVNSSTKIRSKNYISIVGGVSYFFGIPNQAGSTETNRIAFYDGSYNFIKMETFPAGNSADSDKIISAPANACYAKFRLCDAYGTTYKHDIQICPRR